jgi:hypothetical protein
MRSSGTKGFQMSSSSWGQRSDDCTAHELNADPNMRATPAGIAKAFKDSLEYRGHRWLTVHVDLEGTATAQSRRTCVKSPLIAMIDLDRPMSSVFEDQSILNAAVGSSALSRRSPEAGGALLDALERQRPDA